MTTTSSSVHVQEQRQLAAQWRRRKALADALAGVVATLVSLWTFYPIDVWKTKLQAGVMEKGKGSISSLLSSGVLFKGLFIKMLHATSSSFAYFYLYSFIVSGWTQRYPQRKMSPAVRLSLSAIAAMLNTLLTLPLDVMASQSQAGSAEKKHDDEDDKTQRDEASDSDDEREQRLQAAKLRQQQRLQEQQLKMDQVWKELQAQQLPALDHKKFDGEIFYDSCSEAAAHASSNDTSFETEADSEEEEKQPEQEDDEQDNISVTVTVTTRNSANVHGKVLYAEQIVPATSKKHSSVQSTPILRRLSTMDSIAELPSLWKGLYPSLLLCSNPSIHYTVFDMAKSHLLQQQSNDKSNLTMMEAFLLGLFAKFCATMATYPLIRAKVMLMVTHRNSMLATLMENYNQHGIANGWYKGCSVQLLHTVLKSALLMMVKERIARTTHRLLVPPRPITSSASAAPKK